MVVEPARHLEELLGAKEGVDLWGLVATSLTRSFRHNGKDLFQKNLSDYCLDANKRNYSYLIAQRWDLNTIIKSGSKPDKMDRNKLLDVEVKINKKDNNLD